MAGEAGQEDRTEAPTPRRLQKPCEEGHVPVSRELINLAGLATATLALVLAGPGEARDMARQLGMFLGREHEVESGASAVEAGKSVVKVAVLGVALWRVVLADLPGLLLAPYADPSQMLSHAADPVLDYV